MTFTDGLEAAARLIESENPGLFGGPVLADLAKRVRAIKPPARALVVTGDSVAMRDPPPDQEADLFRRGREVLGKNGGGMIRNLLLAKGGNVALARAAIEQASQRGDAREYVAAMLRTRDGGPAPTRNGTAALLARIKTGGRDADDLDARPALPAR